MATRRPRRCGDDAQTGERLYNGITLGTPWPPRLRQPDEHPVLPPYLADPPPIIPIDVGRQLFVDDFLIETTKLQRVWHHATYHPANPVLRPERRWEQHDEAAARTGARQNPSAMVFSDGVLFDPKDRLFKMLYMAGYGMSTCLATSEDGVTWTRPSFDVGRGNQHRQHGRCAIRAPCGSISSRPTAQRRFKMSLFNNERAAVVRVARRRPLERGRHHAVYRRSIDVFPQSVSRPLVLQPARQPSL